MFRASRQPPLKESIVDVRAFAEGDWNKTNIDRHLPPGLKIRLNLTGGSDVSSAVEEGKISGFLDFLSTQLVIKTIDELLPSVNIVGNASIIRPTFYIFPSGQGDASIFAINGFTLLVDAGFARDVCFWQYIHHLARIDMWLLTHVGVDNLFGLDSFIERKANSAATGQPTPELGTFFLNVGDDKVAVANGKSSGNGVSHAESLLLNICDCYSRIVDNLHRVGMRAEPCHGVVDALHTIQPLNLYHKIGHGSLDMYIINPLQDSKGTSSKEMKDFLSNWGRKGALQSHQTSVGAVVVWKPYDGKSKVLRILFSGIASQAKLFEGLDRLKHIGIFHSAANSEKSSHSSLKIPEKKQPAKSIAKPSKQPEQSADGPAKPEPIRRPAHMIAASASEPGKDAKKPLLSHAIDIANEEKSGTALPAATSTPKKDFPKAASHKATDTNSKLQKDTSQQTKGKKVETESNKRAPRSSSAPEKKAVLKKVGTKSFAADGNHKPKAENLETATNLASGDVVPASAGISLDGNMAINSGGISVPNQGQVEAEESEDVLVEADERKDIEKSAAQPESVIMPNCDPCSTADDLEQAQVAEVISQVEVQSVPEPLLPSDVANFEPSSVAVEMHDRSTTDDSERDAEPGMETTTTATNEHNWGEELNHGICVSDEANSHDVIQPGAVQSEVAVDDVQPEVQVDDIQPEVQVDANPSESLMDGIQSKRLAETILTGIPTHLIELEVPENDGHTEQAEVVANVVQSDTLVDVVSEVTSDMTSSSIDENTVECRTVEPADEGNKETGDLLPDQSNVLRNACDKEPAEPSPDQLTARAEANNIVTNTTSEEVVSVQDSGMPMSAVCIDTLPAMVNESTHEEREVDIPAPVSEEKNQDGCLSGNDIENEAAFDPQKQWGIPEGLPAPANGKELGGKKQPEDTEATASHSTEKKTALKAAMKKPDAKASTGLPKTAATRSATAGEKSKDDTAVKDRVGLASASFVAPRSTAVTAKKTRQSLQPGELKPMTTANREVASASVLGLPTKADTKATSHIVMKKSSVPSAAAPPISKPVATASTVKPATAPKAVFPFYVDLAYVPCHGDRRCFDGDFFRRVRARYYILSAASPDVNVLDMLLDARQSWDDASVPMETVTVVPTYTSDALASWISTHRDRLARLNVDVAPSADQCTVQLDDFAFKACRIEF